mmetsp:Transcript_6123/g.16694  ORF Transcript_6123/g.16694 Transcript_6123/m.16694 type:complete len:129 (+) Transcript_6123:255-641(+)|eukprot:CAMPEP_0198116418 /NCGR_PEP_ID=MMETSP1442-20131203/12138_1 /TAXON_ID= /ORGANISM="Craspedostauros australis, Strain CCMP3328" /LENGTH=128 /DNA_ID=CAMNT_0043774223 /DNA_START=217 /DNA_END=603 /DNA_ORIENTATION=+
MAKSIRSKCKRKARSEFRSTIGTKAHNETAARIQKKLQENIGKQSMESLERISSVFEKSQATQDMVVTATSTSAVAIDANETMSPKGENKVPVKRSRRAKKKLGKKTSTDGAVTTAPNKRRPKFFCQF